MNRMATALSRALQWLSRVNSPVVGAVLAGPAHRLMSRQLVLVTFIGRKTGHPYARPVSYVREGNELLVPGGGRWWKNLESGPVAVRLVGSWMPVTPEVIVEPQAMSEVLARMMAANPALSVFTGIRRGAEGRPDPQSLEREQRRGFVVVRLRLDDHMIATDGTRSAVA